MKALKKHIRGHFTVAFIKQEKMNHFLHKTLFQDFMAHCNISRH